MDTGSQNLAMGVPPLAYGLCTPHWVGDSDCSHWLQPLGFTAPLQAWITGVMQGCSVDHHLGMLSARHLVQVVFCGAYAAKRWATEGRRQINHNWEERVATVSAARRALRQARGDITAGPDHEGTEIGLPLPKQGQRETSL